MNDPKKHHNATEWRLVPMVNLASLVVPTVLMAAWVTLHTLQATAPDILSAAKESQLDLAVHITPHGFEIAGDDGVLSAAGRSITVGCAHGVCESAEDYDLDELQRRLVIIKQAHPAQADITLVPHPETPYRQIVEVRQAVSHSTTALGEAELFPWVAISESR